MALSIDFNLAISADGETVTATITEFTSTPAVTTSSMVVKDSGGTTLSTTDTFAETSLQAVNDFRVFTTVEMGGTTGTEIADDIYTFEYTVSNGVDTTTFTEKIYIYSALECKIIKLSRTLPDINTGCSCDTGVVDDFLKSYAIFKQFEYAISSGEETKASNLYTLLDKFLKNIDCCE